MNNSASSKSNGASRWSPQSAEKMKGKKENAGKKKKEQISVLEVSMCLVLYLYIVV